MKARKIMIAVGLEQETNAPLMKIKEMSISSDAEIHLVHIVPVILYARGMQFSVMTYPLDEDRPKIQEVITEKLKALGSDLFPGFKNIKYACLFDANEKAAFTNYVEEQKGDLVVVATRGKKGLSNFFDSSFAQHQLKYSPANVLVLR